MAAIIRTDSTSIVPTGMLDVPEVPVPAAAVPVAEEEALELSLPVTSTWWFRCSCRSLLFPLSAYVAPFAPDDPDPLVPAVDDPLVPEPLLMLALVSTNRSLPLVAPVVPDPAVAPLPLVARSTHPVTFIVPC